MFEKYLTKGIKEVITEFPQIGELLNGHNIGCVSCNVGTCLLKDVISIHGLPKAVEAVVMAQIASIVEPGEHDAAALVETPIGYAAALVEAPIGYAAALVEAPIGYAAALVEAPIGYAAADLKYSPPVKKLVDEHVKIKKLLSRIPAIIEGLESKDMIDRKLIESAVYFIQNYADKFHHAKEEDILFKYADETLEIISVMHEDHKAGRSFVKLVLAGLEEESKEKISNGLKGYKNLLTEHIRKEDEILYPWIDRGLTTRQVGELMVKFSESDKMFGHSISKEFDEFIESIEK